MTLQINPSLRFSTSIFLISPHSKNHPNQHNCWLFYFLKNLTQKLFFLNQLYRGLEYIGSEYEKIIEIYNHQIRRKYGFDTSQTYFDCTNFYFEIDREDDWRKKGQSRLLTNGSTAQKI